RASAATPVTPSVNGGEGRLPGASTKLTNPVTSYVPLPAPKPVVVHVPPPVTSCARPGLERKVPLPVSVIMLAHEDAAHADAFPPGNVVVGGGSVERWMMSHWYRWLDEPPEAPPTSRDKSRMTIPANGSAKASNLGLFISLVPPFWSFVEDHHVRSGSDHARACRHVKPLVERDVAREQVLPREQPHLHDPQSEVLRSHVHGDLDVDRHVRSVIHYQLRRPGE